MVPPFRVFAVLMKAALKCCPFFEYCKDTECEKVRGGEEKRGIHIWHCIFCLLLQAKVCVFACLCVCARRIANPSGLCAVSMDGSTQPSITKSAELLFC